MQTPYIANDEFMESSWDITDLLRFPNFVFRWAELNHLEREKNVPKSVSSPISDYFNFAASQ